MAETVPSRVASFIRDHVSSLEQLEILLWLRQHPGRACTAVEVARELRTLESSARSRLSDLATRGLLHGEGGAPGIAYRYVALDAAREQVVAELDREYATHRYAVIELIFSKPLENVTVFPRER